MKIATNSKNINKNDIFLAFNEKSKYIKDAINKKPKLIITNNDIIIDSVPIIKTKKSLYDLLTDYYKVNNNSIKLIGITGTDGKTTTATITHQILQNFMKGAYLGTNGFKIKKTIDVKNTTPELNEIFKFIKQTKLKKGKFLSMEVSSEGLYYNRCEGLLFDIAILTNITSDHLNTHKNITNYVKCKLKLFKQIKENGYAIINLDDKHAKYIINNCKANIITYGKNKKSDAQISNIKLYPNKTTFIIKYKNNIYPVTSPLLGEFNVYNLTASIIAINSLGIPINKILNQIKKINPIKGRLEYVNTKLGFNIVIDHAHTINATKKVLQYFNKIKKNKIITIVGCAGKRDKTKRNKIGSIVTKYSNYVFFTTDDPRDENPMNIIKEMIKNNHKNNFEIIIDREKAIEEAMKIAKKDDIILVLGKGNDKYMAINNTYIKYNDFDTIQKILRKKS